MMGWKEVKYIPPITVLSLVWSEYEEQCLCLNLGCLVIATSV